MFMSVAEIEGVLGELSAVFKVDAPFYEYSEELREEGIRAEYDPSMETIYTSEPENLVLALHEFAHYVFDMRELRESDPHGPGYGIVTAEISFWMNRLFDLRFSMKEILDVPFGEEFIA